MSVYRRGKSWHINITLGASAEVKGDSMVPEYRESDIIVVSPARQPRNGDDIVAAYEGEVTFKRVKKRKDGITLWPLNPRYAPMFLTAKAAKLWDA